MRTYRVVDLRQDQPMELTMQADTPEGAARAILGVDVVRGGNKRALVAKVYSESSGGLSMVRLYARTEGFRPPDLILSPDIGTVAISRRPLCIPTPKDTPSK